MIIETTDEDYASLLSGRAPRGLHLADTPIAPPEVLAMLAALAARIGQSFSPASWLIVDNGEVVGLCSVKEPIADGAIDLGYGIAPSRRNRGIASQAIGEVVAWAMNRPDVTALTAETKPENSASQRVLMHGGFVKVGERIDEEDGLVIRWHHPTG